MTASSRKAIKKISDRKLKSLGGKVPFSTISKRSESPRKRPRKKSERERIYGPPGYVEWIHEQPCIACGVVGFSEVAHIKTGGTGRKDDWTRTVPLCGFRRWPDGHLTPVPQPCHDRLHQIGRSLFEHAYSVNLERCAAVIQSRWQSRIQEREE